MHPSSQPPDIARMTSSRKIPRLAGGRFLLLSCCALAVAWLIVDGLLLPPPFGGTDFYYFKDPGINWATGLGFVSRFTFGNPTFDYKIYAQYPPVYPALFGLVTKLLGVSASTSQIFNAALGVALGVAGFLSLKPVLEREPFRVSTFGLLVAVFAVVVINGFYFPAPDRPDGLGVCLGLLALVALRWSASSSGEFIAGMLCGASLLTSPFAGIWASIAIAIVVLDRHFRTAGLWPCIGKMLVVGAGLICVLAAALALFYLVLPGWLPAFVGVLTGETTRNETGGGYFLALLHGDVRTWLGAFPTQDPNYFVSLAKLLAVQIVLVGAVILDLLRSGSGTRALPFVLLVASSPLCLLAMPYQGNYPAMTAALLLGGTAAVVRRMPAPSRSLYASASLIGLAAIFALSAPDRLRDFIVRVSSQDSMVRALAVIDHIRKDLGHDDRLIAVSPQTYILWRQEGLRPLTTTYSGFEDPDNRKRLAYVAMAFSGSGDPLAPQIPIWLTEAEYRIAFEPALPQYATVLGHIASRSSQTWESRIYARRDGTASTGAPNGRKESPPRAQP